MNWWNVFRKYQLQRINELSIKFEHTIVCGDMNANAYDINRFGKLHTIADNLTCNDSCPTYVVGETWFDICQKER